MKQCSKCKEWKEENEFNKNKHSNDGLSTICKYCSREKCNQYRRNNREKERARNRKYYIENREKERERGKKYYKDNKEKEIIRRRKYEAKNEKLWMEILKEKFGSLSCSRCGYDECWAAIDFHSEKDHTALSKKLHRKPTPEKIKELDEGILLCSNCHRMLHQGGGFKS